MRYRNVPILTPTFHCCSEVSLSSFFMSSWHTNDYSSVQVTCLRDNSFTASCLEQLSEGWLPSAMPFLGDF